MSQEKTGEMGETGEPIDSTNIFDEFSQDESLKKEVEEIQTKKQKGSYYFLSKLNSFLKGINIVLFLALVVFISYVYVQKNEDMYNAPYLDPFCSFLLPDGLYEETYCGSVASMLAVYEKKEKELSTNYYNRIYDIIGDVYAISNFIFSKEVLFLLDRSENRLHPLQILEEFDRLKNNFEPINKTKLTCFDIVITDDSTMTVKCEAYSSQWDRKIIGFSGKVDQTDQVAGTSISLASSFINYLEKNSKRLVVIEKPKKLSSEEVVDYGKYTKKTTFVIKLKLKSTNIGLLK